MVLLGKPMNHAQNFSHNIWIHYRIEHFEFAMVRKCNCCQCLAIQFTVRKQYHIREALPEICQTVRATLDYHA